MMNAFIEFLKNPDIYNRFINYIHESGKVKPVHPGTVESVLIFAIDLLVSLGCIYAAILFLRIRSNIKQYAWFLFIWNFGWFIFLLVFKGIWETLNYLIIQLQPDLMRAFADNFSIAVILAAVLVYIWLLARTFNLSFFGALGVFLSSHLLYSAAIFLLLFFMQFQEGNLLEAARGTLGPVPDMNNYIADINKILSRQDALLLFRIKPYHL